MVENFSRRPLSVLSLVILTAASFSFSGCAQLMRRGGDGSDPSQQELKSMLAAMNSRLEALEAKLTSVNEKVDQTRTSVDSLAGPQKAKATPVIPHAANGGGIPVEAAIPSHDPEAGYINDAPVRAFRKAMVLYLAGKYPDAVLAFSSFVEAHPDHPMAGSAQYYVGSSYFKQGEYKIAVQEFQRVLTSYDRSSKVAETLRDMAEAEDQLKRSEDAARHRQMLTSLFPQSPAAVSATTASLRQSRPSQEASAKPAQTEARAVIDPAPVDEPVSQPITAPATTGGEQSPTAAHPTE